jgi:long-subunit fatty acid transport protein
MKSTLSGVSDVANGFHSEETPTKNDKYSFHTPLRATGSIGYQFAKRGILSLDYEFVDYSSSKFNQRLGGLDFSLENGDIKSVYRAVGNLRIGGEYKATNALSLRVGIELLGNPYKSNNTDVSQLNQDYNFKTYNGGIGYRTGKYSFDLTFGLGDKTSSSYLYTLDGVNVDPVRYHSFTHEVLFTFCMRI